MVRQVLQPKQNVLVDSQVLFVNLVKSEHLNMTLVLAFVNLAQINLLTHFTTVLPRIQCYVNLSVLRDSNQNQLIQSVFHQLIFKSIELVV